MSRGFKSAEISHSKPSASEKKARQVGYAHTIKELNRVSNKNANIKVWMDRPPYHAREAYEKYENEQG